MTAFSEEVKLVACIGAEHSAAGSNLMNRGSRTWSEQFGSHRDIRQRQLVAAGECAGVLKGVEAKPPEVAGVGTGSTQLKP